MMANYYKITLLLQLLNRIKIIDKKLFNIRILNNYNYNMKILYDNLSTNIYVNQDNDKKIKIYLCLT